MTNVRKIYQSWERGVRVPTRSLTFVCAEIGKNYGERVLCLTSVFRSLLQLLFQTFVALTEISVSHSQKFLQVFTYRLELKPERVDMLFESPIIRRVRKTTKGDY